MTKGFLQRVFDKSAGVATELEKSMERDVHNNAQGLNTLQATLSPVGFRVAMKMVAQSPFMTICSATVMAAKVTHKRLDTSSLKLCC